MLTTAAPNFATIPAESGSTGLVYGTNAFALAGEDAAEWVDSGCAAVPPPQGAQATAVAVAVYRIN